MTTFVTCGNHQDHPAGAVVKHTVAEVRLCWAQRYYEEEQARQEANAEMGYEHYLERKVDDGFDEWEARRGVVDFSLAYQDYLDKEMGLV